MFIVMYNIESCESEPHHFVALLHFNAVIVFLSVQTTLQNCMALFVKRNIIFMQGLFGLVLCTSMLQLSTV